MVIDNKKTTF